MRSQYFEANCAKNVTDKSEYRMISNFPDGLVEWHNARIRWVA